MSKKVINILSLLLSFIILSASCPLSVSAKADDTAIDKFYRATGDVPVTPDNASKDVRVISTPQDYYALFAENSKSDPASTRAAALPNFVDNSATRFFPAIGDQGGLGSCQSWAQVYYQFTYTMNKEQGITTTTQNTFSPQWAYNVVAGTDDMVGIYYELYNFMKIQGNVFQSQVPYTEDTSSYSPTEDIWKTSIRYRLKDYQKFDNVGVKGKEITSNSDSDLLAIKTSLSNGDVLTFSTYINSFESTKIKTNPDAPENSKYAGQQIAFVLSGKEGSHRMTIVGYNDNIWCDINSDNVVDNGEMGAFKIANSWGSDWANSGYTWVAYDALNEVSSVKNAPIYPNRISVFNEICRIDVENPEDHLPLYLQYTLNTADRTQAKVIINTEKDGTYLSRQVYSNCTNGDKIAYDGSKSATDATMVALLKNTAPDITSENFSDYSISITVKDSKNDSSSLIVKDLRIVDSTNGKVYTPKDSFPVTLNGSEKTIEFTESDLNHAVVYYRGYSNVNLHYKVANDSFNTAAMVENTERRGYTHKYVIDLKDADTATLYFSDNKNNVDNNNGVLFTATRGLNYYVTENVSAPLVAELSNDFGTVADKDRGDTFYATASGGYSPYLYQFTITNLATNEVITREFDANESFVSYLREVGKYEIRLEVKDFSDNIAVATQTIEIQDLPFSFEKISTEKEANLVGNTVTVNATSCNEKIKYAGYVSNVYNFVIKDEQGNVCHTATERCKTYSLATRYTQSATSFTPHKSGTYTATVTSTDGNNQTATLSFTFNVYDKTYGDSNSDGMVSVMDATHIQRMLAGNITADEINNELADCDANSSVDVLDATLIQRYIAQLSGTKNTGSIIEYIPPVKPTEPPTEPPTEKPTEPPVSKNTVTFTNSFNWSGTIKCYYWSDENTSMTVWPGATMSAIGVNDFGQTMYTFEVPQGAKYLIFTNGSSQTTDITYSGGEVRYYPISTTDSKGHNLIKTW